MWFLHQDGEIHEHDERSYGESWLQKDIKSEKIRLCSFIALNILYAFNTL